MGGLPDNFLLRGSFWNSGYPNESRESPISERGISRSVFGESIEGHAFDVLKNDLLTSMAINDKLSETLNIFIRLSIAKTICLGGVSLLRKKSVGNSGAGKYYKGRSRLVVLRQKV